MGSSPTDGTKTNNVKLKKKKRQNMNNIENLKRKRMNELTVEDFHPNKIIHTIENMYTKGAEDAEDIWRRAVVYYLDEIGKEPREFCKILKRFSILANE